LIASPVVLGTPEVVMLDLAQISEDAAALRPLIATHASPWPGEIAVFRSASTDGFALLTTFGSRGRIGTLAFEFFSGPTSRFDLGNALVDDLLLGRWKARPTSRCSAGRMRWRSSPQQVSGRSSRRARPPTGKAAVYARNRTGAPWIDVMRPSGRDFPLQPHFGVNRIANWSPSVSTTITTEGLPFTSVGTVSHPTLAATKLAASMRRWRLTSAAVVDSVADQRSAGWAWWRGNAAGLGG
jgi:hypothetical protein